MNRPLTPNWLHVLAFASLVLTGLCALVILIDVLRSPQHMWIMNIVWPGTALASGLALWGYFGFSLAETARFTFVFRENNVNWSTWNYSSPSYMCCSPPNAIGLRED